jgi:SAM-dependent methyltransferase
MVSEFNCPSAPGGIVATPKMSSDFDDVYRSALFHWAWSDVRIPGEIKTLVAKGAPHRALELGCGLGRFSRYVAQQGIRATGVDFSPVAIAKAQAKVAGGDVRPDFIVGDVTHLDALEGPFDVSFDVGCFHCLDPEAQQAYVSEVFRLLKPGGTHLIWAMDASPSKVPLSPAAVEQIFAPAFKLQDARRSRRRLVSSHWYWLVRS